MSQDSLNTSIKPKREFSRLHHAPYNLLEQDCSFKFLINILNLLADKLVKTADRVLEFVIIDQPRDMTQVCNTEMTQFSLALSLEALPHRYSLLAPQHE